VSSGSFPDLEEDILQSIIGSTEDLFMLTRPDGTVAYVSPACELVTGYVQDELMGTKPQIYHPDCEHEVKQAQAKALDGHPGSGFEYCIVTKSGEPRWVSHSWSPVSRNGQVQLVVSIIRDVTERKQTESKLRELVENLNEGVGIVDTEENFIFVNPAGERIFGVEPGTLVGRNLKEFLDPENDEFIRSETERRSRGEKSTYMFQIKRPDGQQRHLSVSAVPRYAPDGSISGTFGSFRDITESVLIEQELERHRDKLEELVSERTEELSLANERLVLEIREREQAEGMVLQLQKLEAVGTLAGGVAHDFNNMMTNILGQAELATRKLEESDPVYDRVQEIRESATHAVSLARQLLLFSRRQPIKPRPLDVNSTLASMLRMFQRAIGEDVRIRLEQQPDLWTVLVDEGNLEQVIMNLALNARDAMPTGGTLHIETFHLTAGADFARRIPHAEAGDYVGITFSDTGCGMERSVMRRVFEPFFTTKEPGIGTGLGLSVVYGIVRKHNGWVEVDSTPDQGSKFTIYLPRAPLGVQPEEVRPSIPPTAKGSGERILLVEDNDGVRRFATLVLAEGGYDVVEATSAEEALELFDDSISLVFSDVVLPGMNGVDLIEALKGRRQDLPVILTSGYADDRSRWPLIRERRFPFLQKPYNLDELLETVQKQLSR
jgi:PAS domain S-box-containing protein